MTEELIEKAKEAHSPEELLTLMQENGMEDFSKEDAEGLYTELHMTGELTDEELENVTGGKVTVGGQKYKVVSSGTKCFTGKWEKGYDEVENKNLFIQKRTDHKSLRVAWCMFKCDTINTCGGCLHLGFTKALTGYCEVEHS